MRFLEKIEFNKIIRLIEEECHSILGNKIVSSLKPLTKKSEIVSRLLFISELQQMLKRGISYSFENIENLESFLENREHKILSFEELQKVDATAKVCDILLQEDEENLEDFPRYRDYIEKVDSFCDIHQRFLQIFSSEGEILDSASIKLKNLRKQQAHLRIKIQQTLKAKLDDKSMQNFLSDSIVTQRNDRYVIPIRESSVPFVDGISHGSSASKATVYVEPKEVVKLNNQIDLNKSEEKQEIYRILSEFTDLVYSQADLLIKNAYLIGRLDCDFAIARFTNRIRGNVPKIIDKPQLKFIKARHPLLIESLPKFSDVIPFGLELGRDFNILVISGPNTGGKTVTIKSVGLLTVMALSGFPIPVDENTEIGIFTKFFADIGDEQSLEDALSTFSSHIKTMKKMLTEGDDRTLILIDEIGSSTDPEQGSALAQVFLEELVEKKITGLVTTHFTPLKVFAEKSDICQNAAMEFDPDKHKPTYHLKLGIPGNSFALEIAEELGLPQSLIIKAKKKVGKQSIDLAHLLKKLENEKINLAKESYQKKLKAKLLERKVEEYEARLEKFESEAKQLKRKTLRDSRDYLTNLQKELQKEISEIKKEEAEVRRKKAEQLLQDVAAKNTKIYSAERQYSESNRKKLDSPQIGDRVWVEDLEAEGNIVEISKNNMKIDLDGFYFTTAKEKVFKAKNKNKIKSVVSKKTADAEKQISTELKLLGLTFDEARPKIDDFLDETFLAGLNKVRIVHGKGTGALRRKIRMYLKRNKKIKEFYSPPPEAGGDGVTVVSFG